MNSRLGSIFSTVGRRHPRRVWSSPAMEGAGRSAGSPGAEGGMLSGAPVLGAGGGAPGTAGGPGPAGATGMAGTGGALAGSGGAVAGASGGAAGAAGASNDADAGTGATDAAGGAGGAGGAIANAGPRAVMYLPNWAGSFDVGDEDRLHEDDPPLLAFGTVNSGTNDWSLGALDNDVKALAAAAHAAHVKVLVSIGGADDDIGIIDRYQTAANIGPLVANLDALVTRLDLDGVDVDLERGNDMTSSGNWGRSPPSSSRPCGRRARCSGRRRSRSTSSRGTPAAAILFVKKWLAAFSTSST